MQRVACSLVAWVVNIIRIQRIFVGPISLFSVAVNRFSTMPLMDSVIPNLPDANDGDSYSHGCSILPHIASPYVDGL